MKARLILAQLRASLAKNLKGPAWLQKSITFEELDKYLTASDSGGIDLVAKPEFKIRYYLHYFDKVGDFTLITPNLSMWVDVENDPIDIHWEDINWNGFSIHHNDGSEFAQVQR